MDDYLKEALEIVKAQASVRTMTVEEISGMVKKLADGISAIKSESGGMSDGDKAIDPQKAIKEKSVTCCVCGKAFKLITKKHLSTHGLTVEAYREQCGYKKGTPLACKALQRARRKKMQDMKLWERRGQK